MNRRNLEILQRTPFLELDVSARKSPAAEIETFAGVGPVHNTPPQMVRLDLNTTKKKYSHWVPRLDSSDPVATASRNVASLHPSGIRGNAYVHHRMILARMPPVVTDLLCNIRKDMRTQIQKERDFISRRHTKVHEFE